MFNKIVKISNKNLYSDRIQNEDSFRKLGATIVLERVNFLNNDSTYYISLQNEDKGFDNKCRNIWPDAIISSGSRGIK